MAELTDQSQHPHPKIVTEPEEKYKYGLKHHSLQGNMKYLLLMDIDTVDFSL